MADARPANSIAGFSRLLIDSGLISNGVLRSLTNDFQARVAQGSRRSATLTQFTDYLIASGFLTCWQCAKLREGRWKGFFLESYKILEFLGCDEKCGRYLAERTLDGHRVVLAVTPWNVARGANGEQLFTVEDFDSGAEPRSA